MPRKGIKEAGGLGPYSRMPCPLFPQAPSTCLILPALSTPCPLRLYHVVSQVLL